MKILILFFFFFLFALYFEIKENSDSYKFGIPTDKDSSLMLLKRLKILFKSDASSVKWRKAFISAFICVVLMVIFIEPMTNSKSMIVFFICFFIFFTVLQTSSKIHYDVCLKHHEETLSRLKKILKQK